MCKQNRSTSAFTKLNSWPFHHSKPSPFLVCFSSISCSSCEVQTDHKMPLLLSSHCCTSWSRFQTAHREEILPGGPTCSAGMCHCQWTSEEAQAAFWGKHACQTDLHWKPAYTLLVCLAGTCTAVMAGSLGLAFPSSQLLNRLPLVIETSVLKTMPPLGKEEVVPLPPWMCVSSCSLWMSVVFWWPAVSDISGDFFHLFIIWKVCIFVLGVLYHPGRCWFRYCQQNSRHLQETAQCCPQPLPFCLSWFQLG